MWRVTGGKHRILTGDCDALVDDDIAAFRSATAHVVREGAAPAFTLSSLTQQHDALVMRARTLAGLGDGLDVWRVLGVPDADDVPMLTADEMMSVAAAMEH